MYDIHVHSRFSPDGKSDIKDYIELIDKGLLDGIGFAEHLDTLPECGAYGFLKYAPYSKEIDKYKKLGYKIFAGAEIDYAARIKNEILERLDREKYDFTICSIHMIKGVSISDRNIEGLLNRATFRNTITEYYNELKDGIGVSNFDVIGHIGVFKRYIDDGYYDTPGLRQWLTDLDIETAKLCAASDKIIEVNTSGLFAVYNSTVPGEFFLKQYYNAGGRMVSLSSDAHVVSHAGRGFEVTVELLKSIGFEYLFLPWNKEEPVKII